MQKNISAIILSAGRSERMGTPKFALKFDEKTTFIERPVNEYLAFGCHEIIVVLNTKSIELFHQLKIVFPECVKIVENEYPEWERFYSLKLAAGALKSSCGAFVSNIDNPFLTGSTLDKLFNSSTDFDYASTSYNGRGGHPFFISSKVIGDLRTEKEDQLHLKEFLGRYPRTLVEVNDEKVLLNVNTKEDYAKYFGLRL
ncbi:MAG: NTP transferase domain-containing protein [Bacteroidales bacterium]